MNKFFKLLILSNTLFFATQAIAQTKKKVELKKNIAAKTPIKKVVTKSYPQKKIVDNSIKIKISTDSGVIVVKLYDSTPLHRDNFAKLVKEGFYDSLIFHRVISNFMIQGGDPNSKHSEPGAMLGNGGGDMARIPAEFKPNLYHKKGTLCAARDNNPEKASSACQFYIVQGKPYTDDELNGMEMQSGKKFTAEARLAYKTIGGTPFLDQNYTVFGEVIKGLNVIDKIASTPKGMADRPVGDIRMKMEITK
ncbi:MAG: peptidylprolyl isomerase [Ferruginibacter sp.]|nr:peptidylprolyl isomerase [Ferruginibacter sp.]